MQKIIRILNCLSDQMVEGWAAFMAAKHLLIASNEDKIISSHYFFTAAYKACLESSLMALSRLSISHDDSISVEYLLNCALQNSNNFPYADKQIVLVSIDSDRNKLANISSFLGTVKDWRDTTLAHLDRRYVNNPAVIHAIPDIDMHEVKETFQLLLKIINTYKGYAESSELRLDNFETSISDDINYLIQLIEQANIRD